MCKSIKEYFPNEKLELVSGGFHLIRTPKEEVEEISTNLKRIGFINVAPSHCTGDSAIKIFQENWKTDFVSLNLGDTYTF